MTGVARIFMCTPIAFGDDLSSVVCRVRTGASINVLAKDIAIVFFRPLPSITPNAADFHLAVNSLRSGGSQRDLRRGVGCAGSLASHHSVGRSICFLIKLQMRTLAASPPVSLSSTIDNCDCQISWLARFGSRASKCNRTGVEWFFINRKPAGRATGPGSPPPPPPPPPPRAFSCGEPAPRRNHAGNGHERLCVILPRRCDRPIVAQL